MKRATPIGLMHTYTYGTAEIIRFEGPWRIHVFRPFDVHPSEPWNAAITERVMARDVFDGTPMFNKSHLGAYSAECSCCYLNITHTEAAHVTRISAARDAYATHAKRNGDAP